VAMVETVAQNYGRLDEPVQFLARRAWRFGTKLR
jgi:hypothetical protein